MANLSSIHLTRAEWRALRRVSKNRIIPMIHAESLESFGLLRVTRILSRHTRACCELTKAGERFVEYILDLRADRYWTRTIAVLSLVISSIALAISAFR